jgi:RTX calcium-binding nonapeptide repeat (4 copies)/Calx-beta domain
VRVPLFNDKFGTALDEDLIGSGRRDRLYGFGGKDRLYANAGDDELYGGDGNDLLDGGAGADIMFGGSGDDLYRVDNLADLISEETVAGIDDGGIDSVDSTITYTLGAFLEKLNLKGTLAINGAGNNLDNKLAGNEAANVLSGGGGADLIYGNGGDDTLIGGAGKDELYGGIGSDTFIFGPADATSTDKLKDFSAEDWIGIYASDYGLRLGNGLITDGAGKLVLDPSYFVAVAGSASTVQGTSVGHGQFVFSFTASTRTLMWDADGAGASRGVALGVVYPDYRLSAADFAIITALPTVTVNDSPEPVPERAGARVGFTINLSAPTNEDVLLTYSTADREAVAGSDFVGVPYRTGQAIIPAGSTSATIFIELLGDDTPEALETFKLELHSAKLVTSGTNLIVDDSSGRGSIAPPLARVVASTDMAAYGNTDSAGIAFVPELNMLFVSDSEVEEDPFFGSTNLWAIRPDGTFVDSFSMLSFTDEPTGLAYDSTLDRLYISDDDQYRIFWVDPENPTVKLGESADTRGVGIIDPEDLAVNPTNGHLFIVNGTGNSANGGALGAAIVETNSTVTEVYSVISLPSEVVDPEALGYDAVRDVFYAVGGGFSANVWVVDRSGNILEVLDVLAGYRHETNNTRTSVKDIDFAPSSDPNDDPGKINLYVADYGWSHVSDGRMLEIDLGGGLLVI